MNTKTKTIKYVVYLVQVSSLEGKILTLIDATISDKEQKRAVKDLASQMIWAWLEDKDRIEEEVDTHVQDDITLTPIDVLDETVTIAKY